MPCRSHFANNTSYVDHYATVDTPNSNNSTNNNNNNNNALFKKKPNGVADES
jgi:hypothetical protein